MRTMPCTPISAKRCASFAPELGGRDALAFDQSPRLRRAGSAIAGAAAAHVAEQIGAAGDAFLGLEVDEQQRRRADRRARWCRARSAAAPRPAIARIARMVQARSSRHVLRPACRVQREDVARRRGSPASARPPRLPELDDAAGRASAPRAGCRARGRGASTRSCRRHAVGELRGAVSAKSAGKATPCARPTATTSRIRSSRNARVCGFARIGPMRACASWSSCPTSPTRNTNFSQIARRMSVGQLGVDAAASAAPRAGSFARAPKRGRRIRRRRGAASCRSGGSRRAARCASRRSRRRP